MKQAGHKNGWLRAAYKRHRQAGVLCALPIIVLAVTGIALQHAEFFGLERKFITSPALLNWYGMEPSTEPKVIRGDDHWAALVDGVLYIDGRHVGDGIEHINGLGALNDLLVVVSTNSVWLVDASSYQLVEKLGDESLP
ncbi:MAG: hypothetical protein KDD44_05000, partial [Bdellovibrionales bacterium]|nr:hypothetical protein [Bdellovibrionales bacterium]